MLKKQVLVSLSAFLLLVSLIAVAAEQLEGVQLR